MRKNSAYLFELSSVNAFRVSASRANLDETAIEVLALSLNTVYEAKTLSQRLTCLENLDKLLRPYPHNPAARELSEQCARFTGLFVGPTSEQNIPTLLAERRARLPFKPDFVRNAPKDSPERELLDDLVDWHQEKNKTKADMKFRKLHLKASLAGSRDTKVKKEKKDKVDSEYFKNHPERRLFLTLGISRHLTHLLVKGSTKLASEEYQAYETKNNIEEFSPEEREKKRVFPMGGRLYQVHLQGEDDNRTLKTTYYSTEKGVAGDVHPGKAAFEVSIAGDIFALDHGIIGTRFNRNPFFQGRFSVDKEGRLNYYDNLSEAFAFDERNILCVTRYFDELSLIGDHNPKVVAALANQRHLPTEKQAFERSLTQFDTFPLWQANENIFKLTDHAHDLLQGADFEALKEEVTLDQREALERLHNELQKKDEVPAWLKNWRKDLENPQHCYAPLYDTLRSDAVNLHGFLSAKKSEGPELPPCGQAAEDDRASGVRNDFEQGILAKNKVEAKKALQRLRQKIQLKMRINGDEVRLLFVDKRPSDQDLEADTLYFYPFHQSEELFGFCLRLNEELIYESQLAITSENGLKNLGEKLQKQFDTKQAEKPQFSDKEINYLKEAALQTKAEERCLMTPPHELPSSAEEKQKLLERLQAEVSPEIAVAFSEEMAFCARLNPRYERLSEANNLFYGRRYLFHTNKEKADEVPRHFSPKKNGDPDYYRVKPEPQIIDHFENDAESEDEFIPGPLIRQETKYKL